MNPATGARFLIGLLVIALVIWGVWLLLGAFPIPEPFRTVILIILVLIALGMLWNWSAFWKGGPPIG